MSRDSRSQLAVSLAALNELYSCVCMLHCSQKKSEGVVTGFMNVSHVCCCDPRLICPELFREVCPAKQGVT